MGGVRKIGVLGGIGPEATGEFYVKLVRKLQTNRLVEKNIDYPQIVINSIPAPELIYDHISEEALEPYIDGLKELDKFGVDVIVMVCNTIHLYSGTLQKNVKTPIIDLRDEIRKQLTKESIGKITVIGTPNTIKQGLYKFDGIENIDPSDEEIAELTEAIYRFNIGIGKEKQKQKAERIAMQYLKEGAEKIILGCTEFAVMLEGSKLPTVNTIDVLVDSVIERFRN